MRWPPTLKTEAQTEAYIYFHANVHPLDLSPDGSIDELATNLVNNDVDAFRHAYASGVFTMEFNEKAAKIFGDLYELIRSVIWDKSPK